MKYSVVGPSYAGTWIIWDEVWDRHPYTVYSKAPPEVNRTNRTYPTREEAEEACALLNLTH